MCVLIYKVGKILKLCDNKFARFQNKPGFDEILEHPCGVLFLFGAACSVFGAR